MSHDAGQRCVCRSVHVPAPLELEHHHIHPKEYGGPSTPENMVWVCPTTHTNTHEILRAIIKRRGDLPWGTALTLWDDGLNRYAFNLAHDSYRRLVAAGAIT